MKLHTFALAAVIGLSIAPVALADPSPTDNLPDETTEYEADLLEAPDSPYEISIEEEKQESSPEMQQVSETMNDQRSVRVRGILPGLSLPDGLIIRGTRQGGVGIGVEF